MKLTIKIDMDNAAFEDDEGQLVDILKTVAVKVVQYGVLKGNCRDWNGNTVGEFKVTGRRGR